MKMLATGMPALLVVGATLACSAVEPPIESQSELLTSAPYGGTARAVPGRIEAEHFDDGGQNVSYFDDSAGNAGPSASRNPTDVDLEATTDTGGGVNVGWIHAGEWLDYTITSPVAATFLVEARVSSALTGSTVDFRVGAEARSVAIPNTGAWQKWATTEPVSIDIPAGKSVLRVQTSTGGFNLNWIDVRRPAEGPGPRLKVISWNLQQNIGAASAQGDYLAQQSADVILTQEVRPASAATIQSRLGAGWQPYRFFSSEAAEGVAIFTRLPIKSVQDFIIGPSSWGGNREAVRVEIDVHGTPVQLFSTHLDWPKYGVWGESSAHAVGRNAFFAWLDTLGGRKIFGGDLNAEATGNDTQRRTIVAAEARAFDSCVSLGNTPDTCTTDFATHGPGSRLDYIYHTNGVTPVNHAVLPHNGLSDHSMLVTEFEVR